MIMGHSIVIRLLSTPPSNLIEPYLSLIPQLVGRTRSLRQLPHETTQPKSNHLPILHNELGYPVRPKLPRLKRRCILAVPARVEGRKVEPEDEPLLVSHANMGGPYAGPLCE